MPNLGLIKDERLTVEWSKYNIRFVGIAPGPIDESGGAKKLINLVLQLYNIFNNPSKRMCKPMKYLICIFLTSDYAEYINGEIVIDGGEIIQNSGEFNFLKNLPIKF